MPINILMPALSPTMEKGNLAKWLKKEGEEVKTGDVIAEIETDKATMEYESVDDGVLAKIVVPEGTSDVPVNQLIAVLAQEGEDVKTAAAAAGGARKAPPHSPPGACGAILAAASERERKKPRRRPPPAKHLPPLRGGWRGECRAGWGVARPTVMARTGSSRRRSRAGSQGGRHRRRPHAGSGPHGRVIARDIEAAKARHGSARAGRRAAAQRARHRAVDVGSADPRALRGRQLRTRSA